MDDGIGHKQVNMDSDSAQMYKKMQILILGPAQIEAEFRQKFGASHDLVFLQRHEELESHVASAPVVFDMLLAGRPDQLPVYGNQAQVVVFCHTVNITLTALLHQAGTVPAFTLLGFNGWPGMINRECLEVSVWTERD